MRSTLLIAACFFCLQTTAQSQQQPLPTQFDKFINQPSIEWAAYANDTFNFEPAHFNKLLTDRLGKKEIKATFALYTDMQESNRFSWKTKKEIDGKVLTRDVIVLVNDTEGEGMGGTRTIVKREIISPDFAANVYTDVTQILFIEHGLLKSYIPWVSPKALHIVTASGLELGLANYFSSCINQKHDYIPSGQTRTLSLGSSKKMFLLNTEDDKQKLKELYGRNLIQTLWPYILDGNIKVFSVDKNKKLKPSEIQDTLINRSRVAIPVYDSVGNLSSYVVPSEPLSPKVFTIIELMQDWYYDHTKNIVFNKIKEAYLYAKKWTADGQDRENSPILKIVF
jgi:hypothetical protein